MRLCFPYFRAGAVSFLQWRKGDTLLAADDTNLFVTSPHGILRALR